MVSEIINWCNNNEGFLAMLLSFTTVIVSVFVSLFVMYKSNKVSKDISREQMKLEKKLSAQEQRMQLWQLKVSTYTYKLDYIKFFYSLKNKISLLYFWFKTANLKESSFTDIYDKYCKLNLNYDDIMSYLEQSKNVFPKNIIKFIDDIEMYCNLINENFSKFGVYSKILNEDEQFDKLEEKEKDILKITSWADSILYDLKQLISLANKEAQISDLTNNITDV